MTFGIDIDHDDTRHLASGLSCAIFCNGVSVMRLFFLGVMSALVVACGGRANIQCEQDSNCDLSGGGRCIASSTTGNH